MRFRIFLVLIFLMPSFMAITAQKQAKKYVLSGVVVDANQKPIQGAIVLIDNKKTDCTTDANGFYKLKVSPNAKTISVFTMSGIVSELPIEGKTVVNFKLQSKGQSSGENMKGDEEQINIGYGSVDKKNLLTPVGKIDGQNPKYASYTNIYDMIRGEVPGVQVNGKNIVIQGPSSINLSSTPLFVIDGMVVESIDDLKPQFVKSIEILKGSSASIYGSRGTNGVILINMVGAEKKK
jgi:TonB-dependent SusC/RagA subfamily outer membrane receptor